MELRFFGAAREVTGSCHQIDNGKSRILLDCGMFQGPRRLERLNRIPHGLEVNSIDAVILSHGHLDHCGRLPLLIKAGYRGPIYATEGSIDIASLILRDAAHIQENDVKRENRRRRRAGRKPIDPLYDSRDVEHVLQLFEPVDYDEWFDVTDGGDFRARMVEAGHILGSACVQVDVMEGGSSKPTRLVFSGDLGQYDVPIMRDPAVIEEADIVLMESTYGDRNHRPMEETVEEFRRILIDAVKKKGKVLIPAFAVGRTQQILYQIAAIFREGEVEPFPVYLDSPMGIAATEIYYKHEELMDEEARELRLSGELRRDLSTLVTCQTVEESQSLNDKSGPCVIMAGAGMCNAGRILHHLKHNLWMSETVVLMVGH